MIRSNVVAVSLACAAIGAAAGIAQPSPKQLDNISQAIASQSWAQAAKLCGTAIAAVDAERRQGAGKPEPLADLAARCALAATGGGDAESASWLWHVAALLDAKTALATRDRFGAGLTLPPIREKVATSTEGTPADGLLRSSTGEPFEGVKPTKVSGGPPKVRPIGRKPAMLRIEYILGADGRLRQPRVVAASNCAPVQAFAMLRAQRDWKFEPASRDGEPVEVLYELTTTVSGG